MFMIRNRSQFLVNSEIHHINTRQHANFHQPSVNVSKYQKVAYYLNALPSGIKHSLIILRNLKWFYKNVYTRNSFIPWRNILTFRNVKFPFVYTSTNWCYNLFVYYLKKVLQGGSNMTGTDLCVNKPHCAAAVRLVYTQISPGHI